MSARTIRRVSFAVAFTALVGGGMGLGVLASSADGPEDNRGEAVENVTTSGESDEASGATEANEASLDDDEPEVAVSTIPVEGLDGDALALAEALNRAYDLTYHASYSSRATLADGTSTDVVVELWRRLPLARRDFTIVSAGDRFATREYLSEAGVASCLATDADGFDRFQCDEATSDRADPAAPAFDAVDPHDGAVTARDEVIDGAAARCFQLDAGARVLKEVCFDDTGVPLVVDDGELRFVATEVAMEVSDADVEQPAA